MRIFYYDHPLWRYYLQFVPDNIEKIPINEPQGFLSSRLLTLFSYGLYKTTFAQLFFNQQISYSDDITLVVDCHNPTILYKIAKSVNDSKKLKLWLWNPIGIALRHYNPVLTIHNIKQMGFEIFTFDPLDAKLYDLHYKNQFGINYSYKGPVEKVIYFCGNNKGRQQIINDVKSRCEECGVRTHFILPFSKDARISIEENVLNMLHSKYLLDITQNNQAGLTLRPIEALLNNKKLITNNTHIKSFEFYRPENIFIWGQDNSSLLIDFLESPLLEIPASIKSQYTIDTWLNNWD